MTAEGLIERAIAAVCAAAAAVALVPTAAAASPLAGAHLVTAPTDGYRVVSGRGAVGAAGGAPVLGSERQHLYRAATPQGGGYWLTSAGSVVMPFGDAADRGTAAPSTRNAPIVGMAALRDGRGYWVADRQGTAYGYGAAARTAAERLAAQAVAIVADPAAVVPARPGRASGRAQLRQEASAAAAPDPAGEAAVAFALAQVGKPYSYGATGPYAYDCSGLAQAAWRAAGVGLPRTAAEQYGAGVHVPLGDLQPGDLVFWATDPSNPATIYHVAISLGGGRTVQATQPGEGVVETGLWGAGLLPLATRPA